MSCEIVRLPGGATAIVRLAPTRRKKCSVCQRSLSNWKLCDFETGATRAGKPATCDAVLCKACAVHSEPDTDHCPRHAQIIKDGRLQF